MRPYKSTYHSKHCGIILVMNEDCKVTITVKTKYGSETLCSWNIFQSLEEGLKYIKYISNKTARKWCKTEVMQLDYILSFYSI